MSLRIDRGREDKVVIFVDDDANNLISFKAAFRRDYTVITANSANEAIEHLTNQVVPVVVTDYKMPKVNGIRFLEMAKNLYPDSVRILLSGHADLEASIDAINKGEVYRYIQKPWNEDELRQALENAFEIFFTRELLVSKNEDLQSAYNELDSLIYSAAHDITSPLTTILGLVSLSRDEPDNRDEYLDLIERSVKKLNLYTKNIIRFHKNRRTGLRVEKVPFKNITETLLKDFQYFDQARDISFDLHVEQQGEFYSDKSRIITILNNLISNGIKYKDLNKKEKTIGIDIEADEKGSRIQIKDNGIGIERKDLDRIYEMYYQTSKGSNSGQGLGLHIVMDIVKKLGGDINVSSNPGDGTSFTLMIPDIRELR